jgi:hypothetical protein
MQAVENEGCENPNVYPTFPIPFSAAYTGCGKLTSFFEYEILKMMLACRTLYIGVNAVLGS